MDRDLSEVRDDVYHVQPLGPTEAEMGWEDARGTARRSAGSRSVTTMFHSRI